MNYQSDAELLVFVALIIIVLKRNLCSQSWRRHGEDKSKTANLTILNTGERRADFPTGKSASERPVLSLLCLSTALLLFKDISATLRISPK